MLAPSQKVIWLAALVVVPLCAAAGFEGPHRTLCVFALLLFAAAIATDAARAAKRLPQLTVQNAGGKDAKWFENRDAFLSLQIDARPGRYQLALALPAGLAAVEPILSFVTDGTTKNITIPAQGKRRGRYSIPSCFVRTLSPWKLWHAGCEKPLGIEVRVYPDLRSEPGATVLFHRMRSGLRHQPPAGRGREFERLREYAPGDSYEEIAWKATARRGKPVVRVFQVERTQDVYAIVDGSRLSARDGRLERYLRAALLLALAAESEGDNFGLVAFDDRVVQFVRASRGAHHFTRCREALFDLQVSRKTPDFAELFTTLQLQVRRRALLLFLTSLNDPLLAENFLEGARVLARKHVTVVGQMQDADAQPLFHVRAADTSAIRERLAGHIRWAKLLETEKSLNRIGMGLCHLRRETAAMDLIAKYNEIKRRQIL